MSVLVEMPHDCPACGVAAGHTHEEGCDVERCSNCARPRVECSCDNHDPKLAFWTGYWPGDEATRMLRCNHEQLAEIVHARRQALHPR